MILVRIMLPLVLLMASGQTLALDLDFYTYGGIRETADAFERIALIFNDSAYQDLFFIFAVLGLSFGIVVNSGNQMLTAAETGSGRPSLKVIMVVALGIAIYQGTIESKGNIHVYDEQLNKLETVNNVPDLIVLIAGFTNIAERAVSEILEDASALPYKDFAGGLNYKLIQDAITKTTSFKNFYAIKSLQRFYQDCSIVPLNTNVTTFNLETLRSGTKDIFGYLDKLKTPSSFTVFYTATDREGSLVSCDTAYVSLKTIFDTNASYDNYLNTICESNGFDQTEAAQMLRCKEILTKATQTTYGDNTLDYISLMKNYVVGMAISDAVQQQNPDIGTAALSNRAMVNEGIGTAVAANKWLPRIRAVVTAIILSITPILLLFVVTGLAWKVLNTVFALFAFLALWGACDTMLQQMVIDQAQAVTAEIISHNMGLAAIMLTPGAAVESISIMGEARGMGITIASFLAITLFKLSPYAFSQIGQNFTNQINKHAENAANTSSNVEQSGQFSEQVVHGAGYVGAMANTGFDRAYSASAFQQTRGIQSGATVSNSLSNNPVQAGNQAGRAGAFSDLKNINHNASVVDGLGGNVRDAAVRASVPTAGAEVGSVEGSEMSTPYGMTTFDSVANTSRTETQDRTGSARGKSNAAGDLDSDVHTISELSAHQNTLRTDGDARAHNRLWSEAETASPEQSGQELSERMGVLRSSELIGKSAATGGNPEPYVTQATEKSGYELARWKGFKTAFESQDTNYLHAAWADGGLESYAKQGGMMAYGSGDADKFTSGHFDTLMRSAYRGDAAMNSITQDYAGNYDQLYSGLAQHSFLMENAGMQNFMNLSENMGIPANDLALALTGQQSLAVTSDQASTLFENQMISHAQYDALSENGGTLSVAQNLGEILSSSARSGHNSNIDNSTIINSDYSNTDRTTIANDTTYSTGTSLAHDKDVRGYIMDEKASEYFEQDMLKIVNGDTNTQQTLAQRSADSIASIVSSSRSMSEAMSFDGSLGLSKGRTGTGGGGSVSTGLSGRDIETDSTNVHRAVFDKALEAISDHSNTLRERMIDGGVSAEKADTRVSEYASEKYRGVYSDYLDQAKEQASGDLANVDMDGKMKEIFESYNIPYNHHNSWDNQDEAGARREALDKLGKMRGG